jgi:hypothetical protein
MEIQSGVTGNYVPWTEILFLVESGGILQHKLRPWCRPGRGSSLLQQGSDSLGGPACWRSWAHPLPVQQKCDMIDNPAFWIEKKPKLQCTLSKRDTKAIRSIELYLQPLWSDLRRGLTETSCLQISNTNYCYCLYQIQVMHMKYFKSHSVI